MRTVGGRSATVLVATGLLTLLAACGGSSSDGPTAESGAAAPTQRDQSAGADASGARSGAALTVPVGSPVDTRSIVYKGELSVRSSDVDESAARASTIATGAGGVVAGDNRRSGDDQANATADLVIRVPAKAFYPTVEQLSDLGTEIDRGISTEDVTEAVVDLDARIVSQKASVDRTRALLSRAGQISDVVAIEQELARREAELASLQARQRSLADQVTLSTITLHLFGRKAAAPEEEPENFLTGLAAGWNAFTASVNGALVVLGALLPFLLAIGIPVWIAVWLLRRRRPHPLPAQPAPTPAPES
jgi:hypothetical protein